MSKKIKEKLFDMLPNKLKSVGLSAHSYLERKNKYGKCYQSKLKILRGNTRKNYSQLKLIQELEVQKILNNVLENSPYYSKLFREVGITKHLINKSGYEALKLVPMISKNKFKENLGDIITPNIDTYSVSHTSGTTGSPMAIPFDIGGFQTGWAYWRRFYDFMGLPETFRNVRFSGRILTKKMHPNTRDLYVHDSYENRTFISTYHLNEKNLPGIIEYIKIYQPELIDGYPSAIAIVAKYIVKNKVELGFKPLAVATTAETLFENQRSLIEAAFKCKVYNQYASSEGAPFITECSAGKYHLNIDTGYFEILEVGECLKELVVTSFRNYKTPLIRYKIGDCISEPKYDGVCSCGLDLPYVDSLEGRLDDLIETSERGKIGRLDPIYKGVIGIEKSQVIQTGVDQFEILVMKNQNFTVKQEEKLMSNFLERTGGNVLVEMKLVQDIPLSKNGKFRSVINRVK